MKKEEILGMLRSALSTGEITRDEVSAVLQNHDRSLSEEGGRTSHFSFIHLLYIIGAGVIALGLIIFVAQVWDDISPTAHILITLGIGIFSALLGSLLWNRGDDGWLGSIAHFVGGILIPIGGLVALYEIHVEDVFILALLFTLIGSFYQGLNLLYKKSVLTFFTIVLWTLSTYLFLQHFAGDLFGGFFRIETLYLDLGILVGIVYIALAYWFKHGWNHPLQKFLYFYGTISVLVSGFRYLLEEDLWHLLYVIALSSIFYLSVRLKSRLMLFLASLFMVFYCVYITDEYFADSIGWPIALIFLGLLFIGIAYTSISISKKYIAR